ncbi:hypothetical protein DPMN_010116 [Dreissena polymorpha]|uniref:Uncharacterized protein n=1 Tax=Dreissena polymorpha TaxID=45954 RepID=A0A9D4MZC1_DREPO|nr:hypothetical protein DPMN_010116 [Dreissena polymorpha]
MKMDSNSEADDIEMRQKLFSTVVVSHFLAKISKYKNTLRKIGVHVGDLENRLSANVPTSQSFDENMEMVLNVYSASPSKYNAFWRVGNTLSSAHLFHWIYRLVQKTKATRILHHLEGVSHESIQEVLQEVCKEIVTAYEYQLFMLAGQGEIILLAQHVVLCMLTHLNSQDAHFSPGDLIQALLEVKPQNRRRNKTLLHTRPSVWAGKQVCLRWHLSQVLKQPGLRIPTSDTGSMTRGDVDQKCLNIEQRSRVMDRISGNMEQKSGDMEQKYGNNEQASGNMRQKSRDMEQIYRDLEQKSGDMEQKYGNIEQASGNMRQKSKDMEQIYRDLEQKSGDMEQKSRDMEQILGDMKQASDDVEEISSGAKQVPMVQEKKSGDMEQMSGGVEQLSWHIKQISGNIEQMEHKSEHIGQVTTRNAEGTKSHVKAKAEAQNDDHKDHVNSECDESRNYHSHSHNVLNGLIGNSRHDVSRNTVQNTFFPQQDEVDSENKIIGNNQGLVINEIQEIDKKISRTLSIIDMDFKKGVMKITSINVPRSEISPTDNSVATEVTVSQSIAFESNLVEETTQSSGISQSDDLVARCSTKHEHESVTCFNKWTENRTCNSNNTGKYNGSTLHVTKQRNSAFMFYGCFTQYGAKCRPNVYGYRGPLHIWMEDTRNYSLIHNDFVTLAKQDQQQIPFQENNFHQQYVPKTACQHNSSS